MNNLDKDLVIHKVIALMDSYSFDTNQQHLQELAQKWQKSYDVHWIYLATIEALYLGRYKAVSVEQILHGWFRMGKPNTHFGGDFERLVSRNLPRHFNQSNSPNKLNQDSVKQESILDDINTDKNNGLAKSKTQKEQSEVISDRYTSEPSSSEKLAFEQNSTDSESMPSLPEAKITAPPTQESLQKKKHSSHNRKSSNTGIVTFQPTPDGSEFFQKLKALADNQRNAE